MTTSKEAIELMVRLTTVEMLPVREISFRTGISVPHIYKLRRELGIKGVRCKTHFGDRFKQLQNSALDAVATYFDAAVNFEIKVYPPRFAKGYRGKGI